MQSTNKAINLDGYNSFFERKGPDANPHAHQTPEWQAWQDGWMDGAMLQRKMDEDKNLKLQGFYDGSNASEKGEEV